LKNWFEFLEEFGEADQDITFDYIHFWTTTDWKGTIWAVPVLWKINKVVKRSKKNNKNPFENLNNENKEEDLINVKK